MARSVIAVTIEHGFIKVLVTDGLHVTHHRALMANPQFFREGLVRDTNRIGEMIRNTLAELGAKAATAVGAVPGFQTSLRVLELPNARGLDPDLVIPREAAKTMGVSQETSLLLWRQLPGAKERTRWLVLSAARRAVNSYLDTLKAAGLKVATVELRAFALARSVNQPQAIIAWVAPDGCEVVIVRNAAPVAQQSLFWGAEPVEGSVLVYRLTEILERTIAAHDASNPDGPLPTDTPLVVCGSLVGLDESIARQLTESLQRPAGKLAPPLTYAPELAVHDYVVNMGLALREA